MILSLAAIFPLPWLLESIYKTHQWKDLAIIREDTWGRGREGFRGGSFFKKGGWKKGKIYTTQEIFHSFDFLNCFYVAFDSISETEFLSQMEEWGVKVEKSEELKNEAKNGNLKKMTYGNGAYIRYTYDDQDRLMRARDNEGNYYEYTYDADNNMTRMYHGAGTSGIGTDYTYDKDGREIKAAASNSGNLRQCILYLRPERPE